MKLQYFYAVLFENNQLKRNTSMNQTEMFGQVTLHQKWSFPLKIPSVNMTKS